MVTKKAAQNLHAKRRAEQRFGVKLNKIDIRQIVTNIQEKRDCVSFVKKLSNRLSVWKVKFNEQEAFALFDKSRKNIVTFMPTDFEV